MSFRFFQVTVYFCLLAGTIPAAPQDTLSPAQVMLRFEKDLYANPEKDLDALWWRLVERYQGIKRPAVPFRSAAGSAANSRPSSSRSPGRLVQAMAVE